MRNRKSLPASRPRHVERSPVAQAIPAHFNFLEKLIGFCSLPGRSVPAESGVQFQVAADLVKPRICVLYHIDRQRDPIFDFGPRPDYLCLYVTPEVGIATVIEMKGMDEKKGARGVEQIQALHKRLKSELAAHTPGPARRLHIQGVLLVPGGAQAPMPAINKAAASGLDIAHVPTSGTVDLFGLISSKLKPGVHPLEPPGRLPVERRGQRDAREGLEEWLMNPAARSRPTGAWADQRMGGHSGGHGLLLTLNGKGGEDKQLVLSATNKRAAVLATGAEMAAKVVGLRNELGWTERHLLVEPSLAATTGE